MPPLAIFFFSNLLTLSRSLQDKFSTLATNTFFTLSQDILPNYPPSAGYSLPFSLPPSGNFITS